MDASNPGHDGFHSEAMFIGPAIPGTFLASWESDGIIEPRMNQRGKDQTITEAVSSSPKTTEPL
jgi:hypothetical protein